jgi:hypothetical protein
VQEVLRRTADRLLRQLERLSENVRFGRKRERDDACRRIYLSSNRWGRNVVAAGHTVINASTAISAHR